MFVLFSCVERQTKNSETQKNSCFNHVDSVVISAIEVKFPLYLTEIDLDDKENTVYLNDRIVSKIDETIKEYATDIEFYDSSQTYMDNYINTFRLRDSLCTLFLVLLKHYPTGAVNSKVLFYDNQKKEFAEKIVDFNLHALYDFDNEYLKSTNLKTAFNITTPEIELVDYDTNGLNDYKFVRLWHNGTFNAIHTTILSVKDSHIDTLLFIEKPI